MKFKIILITMVTMVFSACNESTSPSGGGGTKTEMLVGKNWKPVSIVMEPGININGVVVTDWYAQMDACEKDGTTKYLSNGSYTDDEGPSKCDPADPQTVTGVWVWNPTETVLTQTEAGGSPISINVVSVSAATLVQSISSNELGDGLNHKMTATFSAQ